MLPVIQHELPARFYVITRIFHGVIQGDSFFSSLSLVDYRAINNMIST